MNQQYQLSKAITIIDHNGMKLDFTPSTRFTWNHVRFVCVDGGEVSRSKVRAAGAKMIPVGANGKPIDMSVGGSVLEPVPEKKHAASA